MLAVNGYYDGNNYIAEGNVVAKTNQKVIITLLDDYLPLHSPRSLSEIKSYMNAATKSIPKGITAVDYIRQLRDENE